MSRNVYGGLIAIGLLFAGAGCGTEPSQPPAPPPPPPDPTRNVAIAAGDNQQVPVGQPVPVPPSVRVTNAAGGGVAGVSVTFAVTAGGGAVTGAIQTTDANGAATVGSWTLGPTPGPNSLTATAANGTGGPATFAATAVELVLVPSRDTALGGAIKAKAIEVPAGVTVTLNADLTLELDSTATINGTIRGACVAVTVDAALDLTIGGTIDNTCAQPVDDPPAMLLVGRGGYDLDGGEIITAGDFEITNDPTLTEAAVPAPTGLSAARAWEPGGAAALAHGNCRLRSGRTVNFTPAKSGTTGRTGGPGRDGRRLWVSCRGNVTADGLTMLAQMGGTGGMGTDNTVLGNSATGGRGGAGGEVRFLSTGSLTFAGTNNITTGPGGRGGKASGIPAQPGTAPKAAKGKATGGPGGPPGLFRVVAGGNIIFPPQTPQTFRIGSSGDGGKATAKGADGMAAGVGPAQAGGDGEALGGPGGDTPDKQLRGGGVIAPALARLAGGNAGKGGTGDATGGMGGDGNAAFPDGAPGGAFQGNGGPGGNADLRDFSGQFVGRRGSGGDVMLAGGRGGNGFLGCLVPPKPGGQGGKGGTGSGMEGPDGTRGLPAPPAPIGGGLAQLVTAQTVVQTDAGRGGNGGDGSPGGQRGGQGDDQITSANRQDGANTFKPGQPGLGCVYESDWTVDSDPNGHEAVLQLAGKKHPVRITKQGTGVLIQFLDFQAGTASGGLGSGGHYFASGSFQLVTPLGTRQGSVFVDLDCDDAAGTFTAKVTLSGLPGGPIVYNVSGVILDD